MLANETRGRRISNHRIYILRLSIRESRICAMLEGANHFFGLLMSDNWVDVEVYVRGMLSWLKVT